MKHEGMDLSVTQATMLHLRLPKRKASLAKCAEDFAAAGVVVETHDQQVQIKQTHQTHSIEESESAH